MTAILGIDPGPTQSAWLVLGHRMPRAFATWPNEQLLDALRGHQFSDEIDLVVIEKIESFGMAVGAEVFETVYWSGRFAEAAHPLTVERIGRLKVKTTLCHDSRAKDSNIRAALIDRFGPGKDVAIGTKRQPGPLYKISGDVWSALAVAVTWADLHPGPETGPR